MIFSFGVVVSALFKTFIILVNNLILGHLIGGKTMVEQKYKNKIMRRNDKFDPFN